MAILPFEPTPFFADKNRAFWNLQLLGWSGAFLLRAVSGIVNGQDLSFFIVILIEAITGFSISTMLSVVYNSLIKRSPLITWGVTSLVLAVSVLGFAFLQTWVIQLTRPEPAGFTQSLIAYLIYPLTLLGAWSALYYAINYFLQVEEQTDRLERLEAQATSAQLAMLRYQLNPHFLFNTLNSISTLVLLKQSEPANAMLTKLSSFLRHTLITQPGSKVTVAQEVETLQLYLEIERMRFEDRLRTEFRVDDMAAKACIPSFLLQPLVENAIKYGVSAQEEGARISLAARVIGSRLRITVTDTGPGLQGNQNAAEAVARGHSSTGVGLANIMERLAQAYGEDHRFDIETPADGGFTVVIEIPYEAEADSEASPDPAKLPRPSGVEDNGAKPFGTPQTGAPA
ncbi:sensor histidine kinase [Aurantiacibacter sp. D1-12]|uniref:sensor histidine kinase n=1 Tax=Aurantiacibacter sp. D1-12 TaxID=2993658 RepID=UPI00237D13BF|nr:sensor histidine kinase [Aurantiacibacter sp. D1-12]MDE1468205.1 sensor histidine kinase [Aurantiacibacter sp. D1-12]